MASGHFDDAGRAYVITEPLPPRPWINYLGNRRLTAFISQNAGGLLWYLEPQSRRITRYHYVAAPPDRPGFYVYVKDRATGALWNPHFAPAVAKLDRFECRHEPGVTTFAAARQGVEVLVAYTIPPDHDVMLWQVTVTNRTDRECDLLLASYLEFGLLEFLRETVGWCYLKHQFKLRYDAGVRAIRYDYHVFEAPFTPRMAFACTAPVSGFDCSRDAFIGRTGTLGSPELLGAGAALSNSELPLGGHGAGVLGVDVRLAPGTVREFAYVFAIGDTWEQVDGLIGHFGQSAPVRQAFQATRDVWGRRLETLQAKTGDAAVDRFINTWNPYNAATALELARIISTDHMGTDGLRYRDTTQDALAVANFDPEFSRARMRLVFGQQKRDGGGCFAFFPHNRLPTSDQPRRCDNTVWQLRALANLAAETGTLDVFAERLPFRDGGEATVYEHILLGLRHIHERRGPRGLPTLFHADWNDGLALFEDEQAESVMLGMQLVEACHEFAGLARRLRREADAAWCETAAAELARILNSDLVWDGRWYRRLLFSNGKVLGTAASRQGQIYINPQSWAVLSGVGNFAGRGRLAMDSLRERLNTPYGIRICAPPFTGIPEPEDPPKGSSAGVGENGGIFCHANTWAIIAEAMLGNADRAFEYYRQLLPESVIAKVGEAHYGREPYVYVSSIIGPPSKLFGQAGISWLTGTASWMYIAATHYLLGVRPEFDGLRLAPCLPAALGKVRVLRRFRGCQYDIMIDNRRRGTVELTVDGGAVDGNLIKPVTAGVCQVVCRC